MPTDKFPVRRCIFWLGRETQSHGYWNRPWNNTVGAYQAISKATVPAVETTTYITVVTEITLQRTKQYTNIEKLQSKLPLPYI